jgi:hypothetical protein
MENKLRPWQKTLVAPELTISTNGSIVYYHEMLDDRKGCAAGELNVFTYTQTHPDGKYNRIFRNQLFGVLTPFQFGTAAQWGWPGMENLAELIFGDPDWSLIPCGEDFYNIGYIPRPPVIVTYPEKTLNN